jgi:trk system potassium uptake protein TrkA
MKKRFAVIGLGYFGQRLALELSDRNAEVIAIDNTMAKIEDIKNRVAYAIRLDSTDDSALRNQGLEDLDAVIVTIGEDFESALLTCMHLLSYRCKRVIVKSTSPVHTKIFHSIGVHAIVSPEEVMAERLSMTLMSGNVLDSIPLADEYSILQVQAPEHVIGQSLLQLDLRRKYEVNLITIKRMAPAREGDETPVETIIGVPLPDTVIQEGDVLVLLGRNRNVTRLMED